jgi:putative copper export protein
VHGAVEDDAGMARREGAEKFTAPARHRVLAWTAGLAVAVAVCAIVVVAVGSIQRVPGSGLAALDLRVAWLLPITRLIGDLAAAATVGCLVAAAVLLPNKGFVSPAGYRWVRRATWPAVVWAAAAGLALPGLLVEFLNTDLSHISARAVFAFVRDTPYGGAQAAAALLAMLAAIGSRWVLTTAGARLLLVLALVAVVLPAVAEYAEAEGTPARVAIAAAGMVLHILGALLWSGTLAALLLIRLSRGELVTAVRRYSRAAPILALTVGASGLLTAAVELEEPGQWVQTPYGRLVLLKACAFAGLIAVGWWHRRRTLPAFAEGRAGAFRRLAAVELGIFAVTFGLAVGLSRTPAPELGSAVTEMSAAAHASAPAAGSD